jgi:hypothetical protein
LKIVKTSDGTQTIEQKTPKVYQERDKHILYTVLSRNEDGYESSDQSRVKTIILKRNIQGDSDREKSKRPNNMENFETSENNLSLQDQNNSVVRRKSVRDESKQKKSVRSVNSRSVTPDTQLKRKTKNLDINEENELLDELPERPTKKLKKNSHEMHLNVSANNQKVPSGTHEIHALRESSTSVLKPKSSSHSFHRSKSVDKESIKTDNIVRRLSASSTINSSIREPSIAKMNYFKSRLHSRRSVSQTRSSSSTPLRDKSINQTNVNKDLQIIKSEPLSDEEIVQREQVTVDDIPELVCEGNNKRKTILISTSDNSNDSFPPNSRARKSFPNSLVMTHRSADANQGPPIRNTNAMVCIPHVFPINVINSEIPQTTINNQLQEKDVPCDTERESITLNTQQADLPSLVPKPSGVFTSEGNTFYQESGAVAALFSENAHRMTDYFKSLLIDTISAISSGVSDAQNVVLRLELEKAKQQLNNLKNENQLKIDKLKKDHADEIRILRTSYGMFGI